MRKILFNFIVYTLFFAGFSNSATLEFNETSVKIKTRFPWLDGMIVDRKPTHVLGFSTSGRCPDIDGLPVVKLWSPKKPSSENASLYNVETNWKKKYTSMSPVLLWHAPRHKKKTPGPVEDDFDEEYLFDNIEPSPLLWFLPALF